MSDCNENIAYKAMLFARRVHKLQVRKYTMNPYADHLAEVAGIVATVGDRSGAVSMDELTATAWLHDTIEDQEVSVTEIEEQFGSRVATGVLWLSDLETGGNRAQRKQASCNRLAKAPGWVQTIKCADLISNTSSIVQHDPKFAKVYLAEKAALLEVMHEADRRLYGLAVSMLTDTVGCVELLGKGTK